MALWSCESINEERPNMMYLCISFCMTVNLCSLRRITASAKWKCRARLLAQPLQTITVRLSTTTMTSAMTSQTTWRRSQEVARLLRRRLWVAMEIRHRRLLQRHKTTTWNLDCTWCSDIIAINVMEVITMTTCCHRIFQSAGWSSRHLALAVH